MFPGAILSLLVRDRLTEVYRDRTGVEVNAPAAAVDLFINGAALVTRRLASRLHEEGVYVAAGNIIAARFNDVARREAFQDAWREGMLNAGSFNAPVREVECSFLTRPWELITANRIMLEHDAAFFPPNAVYAEPQSDVFYRASGSIFIGSGVRLGAGVVLDADAGPVIIDDDATILPHAVIIGPAYIGQRALIKAGAKVYEGSIIGPECKVGGEIEDTIFHSFANKQHDGFVGHSYFASWTNLGADTNTSDLKNNYSEVRAVLEGAEYRTGTRFLGTIMAEHSKCGINTMFNTGTVVGVGCNIFGADFPPKYIPNFSWGGSVGLMEHDLERFLSTAETVMARRNVPLKNSERDLYRAVFHMTEAQRTSHMQSFTL